MFINSFFVDNEEIDYVYWVGCEGFLVIDEFEKEVGGY